MDGSHTEKRTRSSTSKVRTGCLTCKTRRVKCDEGKPSCKRCISAGRACEGYKPPKAIAPGSLPMRMICYMPPPQNLTVDLVPFRGSEKEMRAFAFFYEQTAKCFQPEFSSHYLLQAAYEEPALRHAIIALSGIHEFCGSNTETLGGTSGGDPFSERQYGKAITFLLSSTKSSSKHATEVFLLSCILLACFENLRGYIKSAMTHVRCGLKLLHETSTTNTLTRFGYVPEKTIRSLFTRLDNQIMELGGPALSTTLREKEKDYLPFSDITDPETFKNLENAYKSFDIFLNRVLYLHRTLELVLSDHDAPGFAYSEFLLLDIVSEQGTCLQYLESWSHEFDKHFTNDGPQQAGVSDYNTYVLRIWMVAARIVLSVTPTDAQEAWDQFQPEFSTIVTLAEALVETSYTTNTSLQGNTSFSFSFNLGILSPLLLVSIRCRNPIICRRAAHILSRSRRCEGIWDSSLAAKVAEHAIEVEEKIAWQSAVKSPKPFNHPACSLGKDGADEILYFLTGSIPAGARVKEVLVKYQDCPLS